MLHTKPKKIILNTMIVAASKDTENRIFKVIKSKIKSNVDKHSSKGGKQKNKPKIRRSK